MNRNILRPLAIAGVLGAFLYASYRFLPVYSPEERTHIDKVAKACDKNQVRPHASTVSNRNIDQVFRDHDGYRLYSQDEDGKVVEESYGMWTRRLLVSDSFRTGFKGLTPDNNAQVNIYKDLEPDQHAFATKLEYTIEDCFDMSENTFSQKPRKFYYVEVHLPKNQGIATGIDSWIEGKVRKYEPMREIK